jgi:hypothetical protein
VKRAHPAPFAGDAARRWSVTCGLLFVACSTRPTVIEDRTDADATVHDASAMGAASAPSSVDASPGAAIPDAATSSAATPDGGDAPCTSDCLSRELANWPMPNAKNLPLPNPARLTVHGDSVVDELTGLTWSVTFSERVSFDGAEEYCGALRVPAVMEGAVTDWRVPTRVELVTLLDRTQFPTIDTNAFPDTPEDYFWSSSRVPTEPGVSENIASRYSVYFGVGETAWGAEDQVAAHTRCVRAGHRRPAPQYEIDYTVVRDRATGLLWQRDIPREALRLETARAYCAELVNSSVLTDGAELRDGMGWRVPSGKELQTLIQPGREPNAATLLDGAAFPEAEPVTVWGDEGTLVQPMFVRVATGFAGVAETGATHHVRCVR